MAKKLVCNTCGKTTYGTENVDEITFICVDCKIEAMPTMTLEQLAEFDAKLEARNNTVIPVVELVQTKLVV